MSEEKVAIVHLPRDVEHLKKDVEAFLKRHEDLLLMLLGIEDSFWERINEYEFSIIYYSDNTTHPYVTFTSHPPKMIYLSCEKAIELCIRNLRTKMTVLRLDIVKDGDTLKIVVILLEPFDENLERAVNELKTKLPLMYL